MPITPDEVRAKQLEADLAPCREKFEQRLAAIDEMLLHRKNLGNTIEVDVRDLPPTVRLHISELYWAAGWDSTLSFLSLAKSRNPFDCDQHDRTPIPLERYTFLLIRQPLTKPIPNA